MFSRGCETKVLKVSSTGLSGVCSRVQSCVQTEGKQSRWFNLSTGVRQGCPLSPTLFAVFIDGLIRRLKDSGPGLDVDGGSRLCSLLYADDIVVLAENEDDLDQLIQAVRDYQRLWRFQMNMSKTKKVTFGPRARLKAKDGQLDIERTDSYRYLGLSLQRTSSWKTAKDIMLRKASSTKRSEMKRDPLPAQLISSAPQLLDKPLPSGVITSTPGVFTDSDPAQQGGCSSMSWPDVVELGSTRAEVRVVITDPSDPLILLRNNSRCQSRTT